jgi:Tol biopolymer transport system component
MSEAARRVTIWLGSSLIATLLLTGFGAGAAKRFSGKIAFTARNGNTSDLYVIGADGTRLRQLTHDAREEQSPSWSPDGKSIAFIATTFRDSGQTDSAVTVVAADGSRRRVLLRTQSDQVDVRDLAWSPNGRRIAFTWLRNEKWELWLLRLDGSADPLTSGVVSHPTWAPDGKRLAYASSSEIFVINVKTRKTRSLASGSQCPVWSPNGKWIAVCSSSPGTGTSQATSIDILNATGTTRRRVVKGGFNFPLAWSPASDAILFQRVKSYNTPGLDTQLFIVSLRDNRVTPVPGTVGAAGGVASWHR